ncbi:MAG: MAC/perforin domain-containing protein, partial [Caulobacter sp.]
MPSFNNTLEIGADQTRASTIWGYGINCITGGIIVGQHCLTSFTKLAPVPRSLDNRHATVIKSSADYSNFLSTTASVSVSGLSWSAAASIAYASQSARSDTSLTYVVARDVRSADIYLDLSTAKVDPAALALLQSQGPAKFLATYGTHCVVGVSYGGSFGGYIKIDTSSASDKETMSAALSASAKGFGMGGSVNASFNSGLTSTSTTFSLTSSSSSVGANTGAFASTDPDGLVKAAENLSLITNATAGVNGAAVTFICVTWDEFDEIQLALNDLGQPNALSLDNCMANLIQLSAEYSQLDYIVGTCQSVLHSNDFAIPAQRGILAKILSAAVAGQHAIQSLSTAQLDTMTQDTLQTYLISSRLTVNLSPITHGQVLVNAAWYTDAAFANAGGYSATIPVPLNQEFKVVNVDHHDGNANLYVAISVNGQSYGLYTRWDWGNGSYFDSPRVDISGSNVNTAVASATWTGAAW